MDIVRVAESPCNQHRTHVVAPPSSGSAYEDRVLLTVSSATCADDSHGSSCTVKALWLSVAITCEFEVVVQTRPCANSGTHNDTSDDVFSSHLAECHGVRTKKSEPTFACVPCANIHELINIHHELLSLPALPECVVAEDVSTHSSVLSLPLESSKRSGSKNRAISISGMQTSSSSRAAKWCGDAPLASKQTDPFGHTITVSADHEKSRHPHAALPVSTEKEAQSDHTRQRTARKQAADFVEDVARELPTIALLTCSPRDAKRALLILRPIVKCLPHAHHHRYSLEYSAALWPVSESVQRVAVSSNGDGVFAMCDRFEQISLNTEVSRHTRDVDRETEVHLVLRGSHVSLKDSLEASKPLQPLLLHVGLRGPSASQRHALRSVLRSVVSGVWCRCGLPQALYLDNAHNATRNDVTEVTMCTTEGHILVFQPVLQDRTDDQRSSTTNAPTHNAVDVRACAAKTVAYTCSYGTRLSYSLLSGFAAFGNTVGTADATATSTVARQRHMHGPLLIAPPWRFVDQWYHSMWFRKALEDSSSNNSGFGGGLLLRGTRANRNVYFGQPNRRRHPPIKVLATSGNRHVWLIRADRCLFVVTVPSVVIAQDASGGKCSPAVVTLGSQYTVHDVQFVEAGCHGGFLLLCRGRGGCTADESGSGGGSGGAFYHTDTAKRYVYGTPASPIQVLFLSLLAISAANDSAPTSPSSLLSLPLQFSAVLWAQASSSLFHPSHLLRFVCTSSAAVESDTVSTTSVSQSIYVVFASSGAPRQLWIALGHLPSLSTWCNTCMLSALAKEGRVDGALPPTACSLPLRVQQWVTHALSAAFSFTALTQETRRVDAVATRLRGSSASGIAWPSLEGLVEIALLHIHQPSDDGYHQKHYSDVSTDFCNYTNAVTDILYFSLKAFVSVFSEEQSHSAEAVACVTAVFAGFCAALRMSGLLRSADTVNASVYSPPTRAETQAADMPATLMTLQLLHRSAQLLKGALEDLCTVGHVSALLACASHLAQTAQTPLSCGDDRAMSNACVACTPWAVWTLLLQPLFDLVWGAVQEYGMSVDVTEDVLLYCSTAVRAMARTGPTWWRGGVDSETTDPSRSITAAGAAAVCQVESAGDGQGTDVAVSCADQEQMPAVQLLQNQQLEGARQGVLTTDSAAGSVAVPVPHPLPLSSTATYTSAELYEVVRHVFLLQGAAAALQLLQQLGQHESTREGVLEMAQMYEAMQQRLDRITT